MRKPITAALSAATLLLPAANAAGATTPSKKVVTKTVSGPAATADRWGYVKVTLIVTKTTTTIGSRTRVTRKIANVTVPEYPNHTDRSVFINDQALPYLRQEVLQAQFSSNIDLISGATATSFAFVQSLQSALLQAKKV
jgi:uncharacterized protein with FMN-binding domain